MRCTLPVITLLLLTGCQQHRPEPARSAAPSATSQEPLQFEPVKIADAAPVSGWVEVRPGVQVNVDQQRIRIAAEICLDPATGEPGRGVPLEAILVTPVSGKEHEAIAVTKAKPSDVHFALLLLRLENGTPGRWTFDKATRRLTAHPPTGPQVHATLIHGVKTTRLADFVVVLDDDGKATRPFTATAKTGPSNWMFAGSFFGKFQGKEVYDADYTGIIIGLCTFGGEVLAWPDVLDPESARQQPIWYGKSDMLPPFGTAVMVELTPEQ
ncbi:MAG: hypothetical protein KGS45_05365 [Planctomycetes bacterium]|nr:hypothetical protein [Planctomycetota bacterium]